MISQERRFFVMSYVIVVISCFCVIKVAADFRCTYSEADGSCILCRWDFIKVGKICVKPIANCDVYDQRGLCNVCHSGTTDIYYRCIPNKYLRYTYDKIICSKGLLCLQRITLTLRQDYEWVIPQIQPYTKWKLSYSNRSTQENLTTYLKISPAPGEIFNGYEGSINSSNIIYGNFSQDGYNVEMKIFQPNQIGYFSGYFSPYSESMWGVYGYYQGSYDYNASLTKIKI